MEAKKPKEQWELELDELLAKLIASTTEREAESLIAIVNIKNFVQKQKVIAKLRENQQWVKYFTKLEQPKLCDPFKAMIIKYSNLLERF